MAIELYPAVDVLGGKAVRLVQGDFKRSTIYDAEPLDAARRWVKDGARRLHVVDLDGARQGRPVNVAQLQRLASQLDVPIQYGGGLRSLDSIRAAADAGATRVVLGTVALSDVNTLDAAIAELGDRVAVSIDVREGRVATDGWIERSDLSGGTAVARLRERGVATFIYTNVDRDGTLEGVERAEVESVSQAVGDGQLIWSGGIGSLDDLRALADLDAPNLTGVIVGKALYEERFTVGEGIGALA